MKSGVSDQTRGQDRAAVELPIGTLTFLMTDIEGSTRAWSRSPRTARSALERHDRIVEEQVEKNQGQIVESGREGDSILAVFRQATDALICALETQRALQHESWPSGAAIRVRVALHTGEAELRSGHYVGAPLYRCAGLMALAHGGQVLISRATKELVADSLPDGVSLRDLGQHPLRDIAREEHVYQLQHADLQAEFPPVRSPHVAPVDLPEPLTSFVGRQADLAGLKKLVGESRLVTVTGPGGVGKSRLAMQLVRETAERWPAGSSWIDLSRIDESQRVAAEVAAAMHLQGVGSAVDVVIAWLANKQTLVVLDNCEHLIPATRSFCRSALRGCPGLSIVATSREPLAVEGESRWPLTSLAPFEATMLFEQRGKLVRPDFRVTDANRGSVEQICGQLDELPLAIELAASRLGVMSEREISRQLVDRLDLLSRRGSDQPRHETMVATIDWSYRLLSDDEATLFRRLSVFRGGFTMASAEAVCGDERVPHVTNVLAALAEKSMVVVERPDGEETRYRLLEMQAAYAEEKLRVADEFVVIQKRHYEHFFAEMLARTSFPKPSASSPGPKEELWKRRESGNLWAALRWAREHEDDLGLRLALEVAATPSENPSLTRPWLVDLLDRSPAQGAERVSALRVVGNLAFRQGDIPESLRFGKALEAIARSSGDAETLIFALHRVGSAHLDLGNLSASETVFQEARQLAMAYKDARLVTLIQNDLGCLALVQEDFERSRRIMTECVALMRSTDLRLNRDPSAIIETLGSAELGCGDHERAEETFKEALGIATEVDDHWNMIGLLGGLSRTATARGDHIRAVRLAGAHKRLAEEYSCREQPWWQAQLDLSQEVSRTHLGPKRSARAWREGQSMTVRAAADYAMESRSTKTKPRR